MLDRDCSRLNRVRLCTAFLPEKQTEDRECMDCIVFTEMISTFEHLSANICEKIVSFAVLICLVCKENIEKHFVMFFI